MKLIFRHADNMINHFDQPIYPSPAYFSLRFNFTGGKYISIPSLHHFLPFFLLFFQRICFAVKRASFETTRGGIGIALSKRKKGIPF